PGVSEAARAAIRRSASARHNGYPNHVIALTSVRVHAKKHVLGSYVEVRYNRRYIVYILMFLLLVINYADRSVLSVEAKPIADDFHLSVSSLGIVFSVFLWTYIVCLLPAGFLADRIGPKKTAAFAIVFWSLATVLTGFAGSVGVLIITR